MRDRGENAVPERRQIGVLDARSKLRVDGPDAVGQNCASRGKGTDAAIAAGWEGDALT